jgi:hypothetical protein
MRGENRHHHLFARSRKNRTDRDHQWLRPRNVPDHSSKLIETQIAVRLRRRSHAQQRDIGVTQCIARRRSRRELARFNRRPDDLFQPRLVERREAVPDVVYLVLVGIDADDRVIQARETGAVTQPT